MMTSSPAAGTPLGDQLLDFFQFPLFGFALLPACPFQVFVAIRRNSYLRGQTGRQGPQSLNDYLSERIAYVYRIFATYSTGLTVERNFSENALWIRKWLGAAHSGKHRQAAEAVDEPWTVRSC
jgi:hypothetical protein